MYKWTYSGHEIKWLKRELIHQHIFLTHLGVCYHTSNQCNILTTSISKTTRLASMLSDFTGMAVRAMSNFVVENTKWYPSVFSVSSSWYIRKMLFP